MNSRSRAGFEILTVLVMNESIFRDVMSYSLIKILRNMPLRLQTVGSNQARKLARKEVKKQEANQINIINVNCTHNNGSTSQMLIIK